MTRIRSWTFAAFAVAATTAVAPGAGELGAQEWEPQIPEDAGTHPVSSVLVRNVDSVWTAAAGDAPQILENADILIVDGVIREIGTGLSAGNDVRVVDGRGMHAIPGLVDEHSHTAMAATNEFTAPLVPEVRVMDALDPDDFGIYRALSGGITTARIMHGSSNPIGGQSAVIKMRWGMEATNDLLIPGVPRFVKFALGENVTRKGGGFSPNARFPHSRQGVEALYRQAFTAAEAYEAEWERYRSNRGAFRVAPRRDLRMEALVDILRGRIRIHAHSYRADEILMLMRVAEEFGFRIDVFTHVLEGYKVAAEMAAHGAAASTFSDWWQYKLEAYDAIPHNAAILHEQGVLTAINTDIPWLQSFFFREIAKPVKYGGVSKEDALKMLSLYPATMMHMDDKIGSLEVGKHGDLVLLSGSPFDAFARVEKTIVDGIVYFDLGAEVDTRGEPILTAPDPVITPRTEPMDAARDVTDVALARETGDAVSGAALAARAPDGRVASLAPGAGITLAAQEPVIALVGGTVHPVSSPPIADGVVVVRGGRIEAVGPAGQVDVPADAQRIDVAGQHVYPGMIDALTTVGILEFGSIPQAGDVLEVGKYNPHIRAVAAVRPEFPNWGVTRANGITAVGVAQSTGVIQGQLGVVELSDEDTHERVTVDDGAAMVMRLPMSSRPANDDDEPELEGARIEELIEVLERAQLYAARPSTTDDPTRRFEANVWGGDRVFLEALVPLVTGAQTAFFRMQTDWEIRHLFLLMDMFPDLRPVVVGGDQAYRVADELARRNVPVVINLNAGFRPTPDRDESVAAAWRNAGLLAGAGVKLGFASDDSEHARNIPYMAAHAVAFGMSEEAALRAITLGNAEILGQGDLMGSLDVGKRADIVVTDGSPLQYLTTVHRMWVGGEEVDPRDNKHHRLYEQYRTRR